MGEVKAKIFGSLEHLTLLDDTACPEERSITGGVVTIRGGQIEEPQAGSVVVRNNQKLLRLQYNHSHMPICAWFSSLSACPNKFILSLLLCKCEGLWVYMSEIPPLATNEYLQWETWIYLEAVPGLPDVKYAVYQREEVSRCKQDSGQGHNEVHQFPGPAVTSS